MIPVPLVLNQLKGVDKQKALDVLKNMDKAQAAKLLNSFRSRDPQQIYSALMKLKKPATAKPINPKAKAITPTVAPAKVVVQKASQAPAPSVKKPEVDTYNILGMDVPKKTVRMIGTCFGMAAAFTVGYKVTHKKRA